MYNVIYLCRVKLNQIGYILHCKYRRIKINTFLQTYRFIVRIILYKFLNVYLKKNLTVFTNISIYIFKILFTEQNNFKITI